MICMKLSVVFLLLLSLTIGLAKKFHQRVTIDPNLRETNEDDSQDWIQNFRRHEYETASDANSIESFKLRNFFAKHAAVDDDKQLSVVDRAKSTQTSAPTVTIKLHNSATTSVRLVTFYIMLDGQPYIGDTKFFAMLESKSLSIPSDAIYVEIIVEKYDVSGNWNITYTNQMDSITNLCLVASGSALNTQVNLCYQ